MKLTRARRIWPVEAPPIDDGALLVDEGRIVAVGRHSEIAAPAGVQREDLGEVDLLPAPLDPHLHLELSALAGRCATDGGYVDWVRSLIEARARIDESTRIAAAREGAAFLEARGVVAVGDIANESWVVEILAESALAGVVFCELLGFEPETAGERVEAGRARRELADRRLGEAFTATLAAHAPQTTAAPLIQKIADACGNRPFSIHVAESREESELLRGGGGAFGELLRERGWWPRGWSPPRQSPVAYLESLGVLGPRTVAVHCVQVGDEDLDRLALSGCRVVTCPRSNLRLGVGRAPVAAMRRRGITVALGTDSLASVDDLDPYAELATLLSLHEELSPAEALQMQTLDAARVLDVDGRFGSFAPGKLARGVTIPASAGLEALRGAPQIARWSA